MYGFKSTNQKDSKIKKKKSNDELESNCLFGKQPILSFNQNPKISKEHVSHIIKYIIYL